MRNFSDSESQLSAGANLSEDVIVDTDAGTLANVHAAPLATAVAGDMMTDLIFKLTVNQFCSVIRQHRIDRESEMMLGMLESLVIAGEIALHDFMERVQNLLPHIFAQIDRGLIKKLTETTLD